MPAENGKTVSSVEDFLKDFVRLEEIGALGVDVLHPTGEKVSQHREKLRPRRMSDAVLLTPTQIVLCMTKLGQETIVAVFGGDKIGDAFRIFLCCPIVLLRVRLLENAADKGEIGWPIFCRDLWGRLFQQRNCWT